MSTETIAKLTLDAFFKCPHCGKYNIKNACEDMTGDNDYLLVEALHERWNGKEPILDTSCQIAPFVCDHCNKEVIITGIEW